jgi:hypothetical protein
MGWHGDGMEDRGPLPYIVLWWRLQSGGTEPSPWKEKTGAMLSEKEREREKERGREKKRLTTLSRVGDSL